MKDYHGTYPDPLPQKPIEPKAEKPPVLSEEQRGEIDIPCKGCELNRDDLSITCVKCVFEYLITAQRDADVAYYEPLIQQAREWVRVGDRLPSGQWNVNHPWLSEEVLIANSCSINIGFYNRKDETWYVDVPAKKEWIDKITHWMPLPVNPNT